MIHGFVESDDTRADLARDQALFPILLFLVKNPRPAPDGKRTADCADDRRDQTLKNAREVALTLLRRVMRSAIPPPRPIALPPRLRRQPALRHVLLRGTQKVATKAAWCVSQELCIGGGLPEASVWR